MLVEVEVVVSGCEYLRNHHWSSSESRLSMLHRFSLTASKAPAWDHIPLVKELVDANVFAIAAATMGTASHRGHERREYQRSAGLPP